MKKNVLIGFFSPLLYFLVISILQNKILGYAYSEKYAILHSALIVILPILPGIALAFLLVRNSLREYIKSLFVCFIISLVLFLLYAFAAFNLFIYLNAAGQMNLSLDDGVLYLVVTIYYLCSCLVGSFVAGVLTVAMKRKNVKAAKNV